jgi:hypothetical protein
VDRRAVVLAVVGQTTGHFAHAHWVGFTTIGDLTRQRSIWSRAFSSA